MTFAIRFRVLGVPAPGGSKRVFRHPRTGKALVTDDSGKRGREWRRDVQIAAQTVYSGPLLDEPLALTAHFMMPRPKGHLSRRGDLLPSAPPYPAVRPDTTKILRALEDALTGVLWRNDALVVRQSVAKIYAEIGSPPGVVVLVQPAGPVTFVVGADLDGATTRPARDP